ncbi:DUF4350 domain-containing protein [Gordonia sp. TBRC 11910]|uniref:DUF4350 domain-containing protein n=1 Tax=Gordonia asplenii TaxID=2725283 RepID=A0A848L4C8_9ACTN|nr:DUF4350 domain-containing protein [Gordonia asplenii]NMO03441.1 DUF4350 domain-containing protein [Gordonia asplenii]
MSAPAQAAPPVPARAPKAPRPRRWILFAVLGAVALIVVGGIAALAVSAASNKLGTTSDPLDPDNPGTSGTRALARVIDAHGVHVDVVRNQKQLFAAGRPDANTTVVVTGDSALNSYTAGKLRERVGGAARLVLLNPRQSTLTELAPPASTGYGYDISISSVRADCSTPGIAPSDVISASSATYVVAPGSSATSCFTLRTSSTTGGSNVVVLPANGSRPQVVVASGLQFTNGSIDMFDNAGVAVRMLGGHDRLLWYIPSVKDVPPSQTAGGPSDIPRAIGPLIALAFVALLAAMVWRGRRFGRLVVEPLPAVVKAIETTQARGRLYHRAGDVPRAGKQLRDHTIRRLTKSLGLPTRTDVTIVIDTAATASGAERAWLAHLLAGPLPGTEDQLLSYANDLSRIEEEVHRRYG